jgi:hypothetical protein
LPKKESTPNFVNIGQAVSAGRIYFREGEEREILRRLAFAVRAARWDMGVCE